MNPLTLKELWAKFLGTPPSDSQFDLWLALHSENTVRHGILKTAEKNMAMRGTMTADHKLRFASKVMNSSTAQRYGDKGLNPPTTERQKEQQKEFAERQSLLDEMQDGRLL